VGFVKFRLELVDASDQPIMSLMVSPMFGRRDVGVAGRAAAAGKS
jgi:hypothetical protein